jgi:leukotriene-A4 hydrolase
MKRAVAAALLFLLAACRKEAPDTATLPTVAPAAPKPVTAAQFVKDPHSYSNPQQVRVEHLVLDVTADFAKKQLSGTASLRIAKTTPDAKTLILDSRGLEIRKVTLQPGGAAAHFTLGMDEEIFGSALEIPIQPDTTSVVIEYASSPNAQALQWLDPMQTAGKKHPFLLSQSQSINARTWVPIQDSPQVRFTYDATVRVPKELMAVMSAENATEVSADGVYRFRMPQPIPAYLLAIAVGETAFRSIGARSGVFSESPVVEKAAREFADTEKMIVAAEELYGPYRWGRYDMLVLPPSFPFGGMENPRLTFLTPTVIAGDKSLVSLIAHELAHSWSGNLVTNATWNDFWLNEGFTTYFEHRIIEKIYGREYSEMLWLLGLNEVKEEIKDTPAKDQSLYLELTGRNPDDAPSIVYEKGALLLRLIEESVGREAWDAFLRKYFDAHAFQTMDTKRFLTYLRANLPGIDQKVPNLDEWINGPGLPANTPKPQSEAFANVEQRAQAFVQGATADSLVTTNWSSHEWIHFITSLPVLPPARMADLDRRFKFTESGNNEVLSAWLEKSVDAGYKAAYPAIERFLTTQGRRKFLTPLYKKLMARPDDVAFAKSIYAKARPTYHPVSQSTIDEVVGQ